MATEKLLSVKLSGYFVGDWAMAKVWGVLVAALVAWALAATAALAEEGRWQQLENNQSCVVWNDYGWRHHLFYRLSNANSV